MQIEKNVKLLSSPRQYLTNRELWLDKYFDHIDQTSRTTLWWEGDPNLDDLDGDGLSNLQEWKLDTDPLDSDTDNVE